MPTSQQDPLGIVRTQVVDYYIVRLLGYRTEAGTRGPVYVAEKLEQPGLPGKDYALRVLADPASVEHERQIHKAIGDLGALGHRGIANLSFVGKLGQTGPTVVVSELLTDEEDAHLDLALVGWQIAETLQLSHLSGLFHGALHRGNVFLQKDPICGHLPILTDFRHVGLAGKEAQIAGSEDVRALGALLASMQKQSERAKTAPTLTEPGRHKGQAAPKDLVSLTKRMQEEDPAKRPTMAEVAESLRELVESTNKADEALPPGIHPGAEVSGYRLLRRIGSGGMGVVFEAVHTRLSRRAAIKVLRPEIVADPKMTARFFTEAESVNVAHHPGIVTIFEFGQLPSGTVFIIMEFLEGESLHERLDNKNSESTEDKLPLAALRLLRQVASTLKEVHARGIVHRDLKPENLMVVKDPEVHGGERVKILDFGLAKMVKASSSRALSGFFLASQVGQVLGTPLFMSPEQCRDSGTVDGKADVYSLGVILYMVVAGRPPFTSRGFAELAAQHLYADPPALSSLVAGLPEGLSELALRMLAKDPANRPDMGEVADALSVYATEALPPQSTTESLPKAGRPLATWATYATACVALIGALGLFLHKRAAPPAPSVLVVAPKDPPKAPEPKAPAEEGADLGRLRARALLVLQEALRDPDPLLRKRTLALVGKMRSPTYAGYLEPLLSDRDPEVQAQAALSLGQLGARGAVPSLVAALDPKGLGRDLSVRVAAALSLTQLGEPAGLLALRKLSKGPKPPRRATLGLAEAGDGKARTQLEQVDASGTDEELLGTWGRLAQRGDVAAQAALRRHLDPADPLMQRAAEELIRTEDRAARTFLEEQARLVADEEKSLSLKRTLAGLDDPTYCERFPEILAAKDRPLPLRILAAEGMGACARTSFAKQLATFLPREQAPLRLRLPCALSLLQIAQSDPAMLLRESLFLAETDLEDERWREREAAALALGDMEPGLAVPLLGRAIRDDRPEVRKSAAKALGKTRVRAAVPVLGGALDDTVRYVRREAMTSIGKVGKHLRSQGEPVADLVLQMEQRTNQGEDGDRLASANALLALGERNEAALVEFLRSPDPEVRKMALSALAGILSRVGDKTPFVKALSDPAFLVRFAAAVHLAERGHKEGVSILRAAARQGGPETLVALSLLRRLGEGQESLDLPKDPRARLLALEAIRGLPPGEALPLLSTAARDPEPEVRRVTVSVLSDLSEQPEFASKPSHATVAQGILRRLVGDPDRAVRTQAGALLYRLSDRTPDANPKDSVLSAYLRGEYGLALRLGKALKDPPWTILAAAACRSRDAAQAEAALSHIEDIHARRYVHTLCQRVFRPLAETPANKEPSPQSPSHKAPNEKALTNRSLVLPEKAFHGQVKIAE